MLLKVSRIRSNHNEIHTKILYGPSIIFFVCINRLTLKIPPKFEQRTISNFVLALIETIEKRLDITSESCMSR